MTRADEMADPGLITDQAITAIENADLVVTDLTAGPAGFNANVFYELGIRHMAERPVVHMIEEGGPQLPFDLKEYRSIFYKLATYADHQTARLELTKQVKAVEADTHKVSNPVTRARGHKKLSESSDPKTRSSLSCCSEWAGWRHK